MLKFAIIDTETNRADQFMSIGTAVADAYTFDMIEAKYHILPTDCQIGSMYESTLFIETLVQPSLCTRSEAIADLRLVSQARCPLHHRLQRLLLSQSPPGAVWVLTSTTL